MAMNRTLWIRLAAVSGLLSVVAGAFAAHRITDPQAREWLRTGASYQAIHALAALLSLALFPNPGPTARRVPAIFLAGTVFFSGSLYAMALGGPRWLGAVTPLGGLLFLAGWGILAWSASNGERSDAQGVKAGVAGDP